MDESFLHYLWLYQLFDKENICTVSGERLAIVHQGTINEDAGPDFFNAKIKIGDTLWVGNIEIHQKSSDWKKHQHHKDNAYDSTILHVVAENDVDVFRKNNTIIPAFILPIDERYINNYYKLTNNIVFPACKPYLKQIKEFAINSQINRATIERLERKTQNINQLLIERKHDWSSVLYILISKYLGSVTNKEPFEMLAKNLPLKYLSKHKNNLFQIEALLFGTAGFLTNGETEDKYYLELQKEWQFLSKKFNIKSLPLSIWKFSKLRPFNFPTIRIAQLAVLIHHSSHLFSKLLEAESIDEIRLLFAIKASEYWDTHYTFKTQSRYRNKVLGTQIISILILNVVVPIVFAYGKHIADNDYKNKAIIWLESLPAEKNKITKKYMEAGFTVANAFYSQGLLTLYENYCKRINCLNCSIGHQIIKTV